MKRTDCPLCGAKDPAEYYRDDRRDYYQCPTCSLVYVPPSQFLSPDDEKKRYDFHTNSADDCGYQAYLGRLFSPMLKRVGRGKRGLDFGCGPAPVLARMFMNAGHSVTVFDLHYRPDASVFEQQYDFISATEVVEHLRYPSVDLDRLWMCLKPGGILGIMTQWVVQPGLFAKWHYKNDMTHILFFSEETFKWLACKWSGRLIVPGRDVVLLEK